MTTTCFYLTCDHLATTFQQLRESLQCQPLSKNYFSGSIGNNLYRISFHPLIENDWKMQRFKQIVQKYLHQEKAVRKKSHLVHRGTSFYDFKAGFFFNTGRQKNKNSRAKLKQITRAKNTTFGRTFPPICKTQEKN